jgi:hypothetical protein
MKMKFAALAVAAFTVAPLTAFAQSAPAPINQTGPSVTPPVSTTTDPGIEGVSGNTRAVPGGIYNTAPGAAVVAPGYESNAAVPSRGYVGVPANGAYTTGAPAVESDQE